MQAISVISEGTHLILLKYRHLLPQWLGAVVACFTGMILTLAVLLLRFPAIRANLNFTGSVNAAETTDTAKLKPTPRPVTRNEPQTAINFGPLAEGPAADSLILNSNLPARDSEVAARYRLAARYRTGERRSRFFTDKPVIALTAADIAVKTVDIWQTERDYRWGLAHPCWARVYGGPTECGFSEGNPILKPLIPHPAAAYAFVYGGVALSAWAGHRMRNSRHRWLHAFWWVPQMFSIGENAQGVYSRR